MAIQKIKTTLTNSDKDNQYLVYPASYADVIFLIKERSSDPTLTVQEKFSMIENLIIENKELITLVEKKISSTNPYKGIFASLETLKNYVTQNKITLKAGDYAIISHEDTDDELYIYDEGDTNWVAKGNIVQGQLKMVNNKLPDEKGNVVITIEDIDDLRNILNNLATKEKLEEVSHNSMKYSLLWDDGTKYKNGDVVEYEDCIYVLVSNDFLVNVRPGTHESWKLIGITAKYVNDNGGKIDTINVNGQSISIVNKTVDIEVPTKLSELENDGDGTSRYATEAYVATNGGKIDSISVNGEKQAIDENKNVEISLPTFTILED